jgi:phosphinothricin acetyltransferase
MGSQKQIESIAAAVRAARVDDVPRLTDIYNHYVLTTPITFDLDPVTVEERRVWFEQFSAAGRHRLFVAEQDGIVLGYAGSHQFRTKKAYDPTIEATVYCAPEAIGRGLGTLLYRALFDALAGEDIHLAVAGITLPNDASIALHQRFGFAPAGVMHQVGRKFGRYWDVAWYEKLF